MGGGIRKPSGWLFCCWAEALGAEIQLNEKVKHAVNPNLDPHAITDDPIVNQVIEVIVKRHLQGMEKFGKTMEANERPINEWVDETIEELLDAIHYLTKTKNHL